MAKIAVIKTGEQYFANCIASNKHIKLDKFIFANVPYVTGSTEVNVNGTLPTVSQIKHTTSVTQSGLISDNAVVYSVVLDSTIGDFEFNYIGLMNSETNTLCMVLHTDIQQKLKSQGQQQGNTLTESLWLEIDGAAQATGITVNAETWMIDYSARMAGEDERIRLSNLDHYGRLAVHSGFNITYNTDYTINPGVAYVAGLRVQHIAAKSLVAQKGESIYIDAWLSGTVTGAWSVNYKIVVGVDLTDYKDGIFQHYVEKIATISEPGVIQKPNIYSVVNSVNGESGSVTVTPAKINAVNKNGDKMNGALDVLSSIGISGNYPKLIFQNTTNEHQIISNPDGDFYFYLQNTSKAAGTKFKFNAALNRWEFIGVNSVMIDNSDVLTAKRGVSRRSVLPTSINTKFAKIAVGKWTTNGQGNVSFFISGINGFGEDVSRSLLSRNQLDYVSFSTRAPTLKGFIIHHIIEDSYNSTHSRNIYGWVANKINNTIELWVKSASYAGHGSITLMSDLPANMTIEDSIQWIDTEPVDIVYAIPKLTLNTDNVVDHVASYPIGAPIDWFSDVVPDDGRTYLYYDGSAFDKTKYPELAKVFPTGKLPDARGVVRRGMDNGRGLDPNRLLGSYQDDAARPITGSFISVKAGNPTTGAFTQSGAGSTKNGSDGDGQRISFDSSLLGYTANENRMKNIACHVITRAN